MVQNDVSARRDDPKICLQIENTELKKKIEEKENIIKEKENFSMKKKISLKIYEIKL